jgi:hypothetical protein
VKVGVNNNVTTFFLEPNTNNQAFNLTADYRTEYLIFHRTSAGTTRIRTFDLAIENLTTRYEYSDPNGRVAVCGDWLNGRFYYCINTAYASGVPSVGKTTQTWEVHRVNYDGTDDVTLTSETWVDDNPDSGAGLSLPLWEPVSNSLYFVQQKFVAALKGPGPSNDINIYTYLKRMSADDGSGKTTVVTLENATDVIGDSSISGVAFSAALDQLAWIQTRQLGESGGLAVTDFDIMVANPDGSGAVSILNHHNVGSSFSQQFFQLRASEKEDRLYFNNRVNTGGSIFENRCTRINWDGSGDDVFMGDRQPDWTSSLRTGSSPMFLLACGREHTGDRFEGACGPSAIV